MKRSQLIVVLAAIAAVVVIAAGGRGENKKSGAAVRSSPTAPAGSVEVTVASSPEKLKLVEKLAKEFNASGARVGGRPVFVAVSSKNSGEEKDAIAQAARGRGGDRPVVWSPASTLWANHLEYDTDLDLVPDEAPSIVRSPLVLAMWEPLARALGWPRKPIGFGDVLRLAQDPRGWAAYGHPEYGSFKLVHTNPAISTSGLEAVTAAYFAATGKTKGLTVEDVRRPAVERQIAAIEQSIVHYGPNTLLIEEQLRKHGPSYASAVAMEETTLLGFNRDRDGQPKLVAIYPSEGSFDSDSPYLILQAPWVDAAEREGAVAFQRYIASHMTPELAAKYGFRPADRGTAPLSPIDARHGADPRQPKRVLAAPEPRVLGAIQESWVKNRKAANIQLVVDVSGSMNEESKLKHAKEGLQGFLRELSPRDRVGLIVFSDDARLVLGIQPVSQVRDRLATSVRRLLAVGRTALYDATAKGVAELADLHDPQRINAVVLLSDGVNTAGDTNFSELVPQLTRHTDAEANAIRVFPIAYGEDADLEVLKTIAERSDGEAYAGNTENIESVYRGISSFF